MFFGFVITLVLLGLVCLVIFFIKVRRTGRSGGSRLFRRRSSPVRGKDFSPHIYEALHQQQQQQQQHRHHSGGFSGGRHHSTGSGSVSHGHHSHHGGGFSHGEHGGFSGGGHHGGHH